MAEAGSPLRQDLDNRVTGPESQSRTVTVPEVSLWGTEAQMWTGPKKLSLARHPSPGPWPHPRACGRVRNDQLYL